MKTKEKGLVVVPIESGVVVISWGGERQTTDLQKVYIEEVPSYVSGLSYDRRPWGTEVCLMGSVAIIFDERTGKICNITKNRLEKLRTMLSQTENGKKDLLVIEGALSKVHRLTIK